MNPKAKRILLTLAALSAIPAIVYGERVITKPTHSVKGTILEDRVASPGLVSTYDFKIRTGKGRVVEYSIPPAYTIPTRGSASGCDSMFNPGDRVTVGLNAFDHPVSLTKYENRTYTIFKIRGALNHFLGTYLSKLGKFLQ